MGCDIHCFIEYRDKNPKQKEKKFNNWMSFIGKINPGRNYWLFGFMAKGIRSDFDKGFEPKGFPEDPGYIAERENRLYIREKDDSYHEPGSCSLEDAKRWEGYGHKIILNKDGKPTYVEHPDWHTHTWLDVDEFEEALDLYYEMVKKENAEFYKRHSYEDIPALIEYEGLLASMKRLEELDKETRIVFWFDN